MVYTLFDKKTSGSGVNTHKSNEHPLGLATQELAEALHKPIVKNF